MRRLVTVLASLPLVLAAVWCGLALGFRFPGPTVIRHGVGGLFVIGVVATLFAVRPLGRKLGVLAVLFGLFAVFYATVRPSNERDWSPEVARPPTGEVSGDTLTLHDVRNFQYRSGTDFTERWETRTYDLSAIQGADLFLSYWGSPLIAHTIVSWDFANSPPLAVSIETRKEKGEPYSAIRGFFREYELYYVAADERDLIGLRTNHRDEEVYLYRVRISPAAARALLLDYVKTMNDLAAHPRWYNAGVDNCTTGIRVHVEHIGSVRPWDWRILVNGYGDQLLYERGNIHTDLPFAELRRQSNVVERAKAAGDSPDFSARIRDGLPPRPQHAYPGPDPYGGHKMWWSRRARGGRTAAGPADRASSDGPPGAGRSGMATIDVELVRQRALEVLPGALPWVAAGGALLAVVLLVAVLVLLKRVKRLASETSTLASEQIAGQLESLDTAFDGLADRQEAIERSVRQEIAQNRVESGVAAREGREEMTRALTLFGDSLQARSRDGAAAQQEQLVQFGNQLGLLLATIEQRLQGLTQTSESKLESLRRTVDDRLGQIHRDNAEKLESMRQTVDERLHGTLEQRLGESFKQVSERLEQVHKGLGEMQVLATGVGDLKKVLTNVKTRGGWGEVQLEALLEQMLSPEQYERNVKTREGSAEVVEFAIRLPGKPDEGLDFVWLPIDAKFPLEDYQRLVDASHEGDRDLVELAARALEKRIRQCAKDIATKYLSPPRTTDFAVMFLPTEGLYAEVVRRNGLLEAMQNDHRVVVAGPSTFAALLNSLQMGFRTLAIQERSSEVWRILGAVKTEFRKFGDVLDGVKKKLDQASRTMDDAAVRSRAIERKLRQVEELPPGQAQVLLGATTPEAEELDEAG